MVVADHHDFGPKEHFMASWRYYKIKVAGDEEVDIGGFFPGDIEVPASASSDPVQDWYLVARADHQYHQQHHQRFSLQLPAELVGLGVKRSSAAGFRAGWRARIGWRPVANPGSRSIQHKQSANPPPFLGWERQHVSRRSFHAERQPPVPVWRHLSAQFQLPSTQRQRRHHQRLPGLLPGQWNYRSG